MPPYAVVTVRARLLMIGRRDEEVARDFGALPLCAVRSVLLPMLYPAILVGAILAFADALDTCVIVGCLSAAVNAETTSMLIYNTARATPTAALNALATLILVASFTVAGLGWFAYRRWGKGQRHESSLGTITSSVYSHRRI